MALKVMLLRKDVTTLQGQLANLRETAQGFEAREAELEAAIAEANTAEERQVVEENITAFENERSTNEAEITRITGEIEAKETEIRSLEAKQAPKAQRNNNERKANPMPNYQTTNEGRQARWFGLTFEQRDAMLERQEVKDFLQRLRELKGQTTRGVQGVTLGIPDVFLPILRDVTYTGSKLLRHVNYHQLGGRARQTIVGAAPEAVWTEIVANINELEINFHQIEMDGYMLSGYISIPNFYLENDNDLALTTEILNALGIAMAKALDKAIVYGTGQKMPVGAVTRLAAGSQPAWWGANQGGFTDLSGSHVLQLDLAAQTGVEFFSTLATALAVADPKYSNGVRVSLMNRNTHMELKTKGLAFNSAAALVSGIDNSIPVVGGVVEELDFMPDGEILSGYFSLYSLVERDGAQVAASDIPKFLQHQTVYKRVGFYDGKPAAGEGFVLINYKNAAPTTSISFAEDVANTDIGTLIVTTSSGGSGKSAITVAGASSGAALKYKLAGSPIPMLNGADVDKGWADITSGSSINATSGQTITVVEVKNGKAVKVGSAVVTAGA